VVCLADHGGDWGALDEAIQKADTHHGEQKWSHLRDLTERLDQAGLSAADLVGTSLREPKLRGKARTKVMKSSLYRRDDSYGALGDVAREAIKDYARADWRARWDPARGRMA
jgi:phosphohistidine phosphatase SixA